MRELLVWSTDAPAGAPAFCRHLHGTNQHHAEKSVFLVQLLHAKDSRGAAGNSKKHIFTDWNRGQPRWCIYKFRVKRRKFDCFGPKSILSVLYHRTLEESKQFKCPLSLLRPKEFICIIQITERLLKTLRVNYALMREFKCTKRCILETITS